MDILVSANPKYLTLLEVMIHSLLENNYGEITIYCLYQSLTPYQLDELDKVIKKSNRKFVPVYVEPHQFDDMPLFSYFTEEIYYRLLASILCPPTLERVLWLDADIIVKGDIHQLFETDFNKNLFVAAPMQVADIVNDTRNRMFIPEGTNILNSGMLLINLELMRKIDIKKDIFNFIKKNMGCIKYPDQDAINALFYKQILFLQDDTYNCLVNFYEPESQKGLIKTKIILHYAGEKPWWYRYGYLGGKLYNELGKCWWSEAARTGFIYKYILWKIKHFLFGTAYIPSWHIKNFFRKVLKIGRDYSCTR